MRYAIYFTWLDGYKDTFNVDSAKERNENIKDMIDSKDFKFISYCPIYANGEYGQTKLAYKKEEMTMNRKEQMTMSRLLVSLHPITIETPMHTIKTGTSYYFDFDKLFKEEITLAEYEDGRRRKYHSIIKFDSREDLTIEYFRVKELKEMI